MAYVIAAPEMMTSAASDLAAIGSNVSAAHMVAAARTTSVIPAAADEVSAGIAQLFSQHAANYQALAAQAAAFNDQFVQHLTAGAFSYASTEAFNVTISGLPPLDFLSNLPLATITAVTTLPPQQALLFLLALPIEIPVLFLLDVYLYYNPLTITFPFAY
jgi:Flp pilus assembly protein TadG